MKSEIRQPHISTPGTRTQPLPEREAPAAACGTVSEARAALSSVPIVEPPSLEVAEQAAPSRATQVLRLVGTLLILSSASTFLLQQWDGANHLERYGVLLAHMAFLAGAGLFCGVGMKESRGARTLLAVALGVAPIQFGVLGGLVYSQFALDATVYTFPTYATWIAPSPGMALLAVATTLLLTAPIAMLAFRALVRPLAGGLALTFLASNLLLLVPLRTADVVGPLAVLAVGVLVFLELRLWKANPAMATPEGGLVRALITAPLLLMIVRAVAFYPTTSLFIAVLWAALALLVLVASHQMRSRQMAAFLRYASVLPAAAASLSFAVVVRDTFALPSALELPLVALPFSVFLWLVAVFSENRQSTGFRVASLTVAFASLGLNMFLHPSVATAFLALVASCGTIAWALVTRQRLLFLGGAVSAATALFFHLRFAIEAYSISNWASLAFLGLVVILLASAIERRPEMLRRLFADNSAGPLDPS